MLSQHSLLHLAQRRLRQTAQHHDAVRVLEALVPDLIEPLRNMALRDGGGVDGAARRLLWLGWEVERDLTATGERA